jgi:hypothetical protein
VLAGHFDLPQLHAEAMAFRCYCATGGLIGYLSAFLQQAVWDALADDRKSITLDDLNIAYERSVWDQRAFSDLPRPFARTFEMAPNVDLLHRVSRIGSIVPADLERRRNIRKSTQESVAACLVAK